MRVGRPPLSLGQHGTIAMERIACGRFRASARLHTWDDEVHRAAATGDTAAGARALLKTAKSRRTIAIRRSRPRPSAGVWLVSTIRR